MTYLFLGVGTGALAALLGNVVHRIYQLKASSRLTERQLLLQQGLTKSKRLTAEVRVKRRRLRQAMCIVLQLSEDLSKSGLYIVLDNSLDTRSLDAMRMKSVKDMREAQAIAEVYVPEISGRLDEICDQLDHFWIRLRDEAASGPSRAPKCESSKGASGCAENPGIRSRTEARGSGFGEALEERTLGERRGVMPPMP